MYKKCVWGAVHFRAPKDNTVIVVLNNTVKRYLITLSNFRKEELELKKYIGGFPQDKLVELNISFDELAILHYFIDFQNTSVMKEQVIENKTYQWLTYSKVLNDLPMLYIKSTRTLAKRFDKLATSGLLEKKIVKDKNGTTEKEEE